MIPEHDHPQPPRFRWLKRLAALYVLLLVVLTALWFTWDITARRRFDAEIARLRAAGQMVLAEDFVGQPQVPDDENAAVLLRQAMNVTLTQAQDDLLLDLNLKLTDAQRATIRSFPVDYAPQLQLARQARQRRRADWGQVYRSPLISTMFPTLNQARTLANALGATAVAHHMDGDDVETLETIRDIRHHSAMVDADAATLIEHLVAVGIEALACSRLDDMVDELAIEHTRPPQRHASTQPTTRPVRPATRQEVQALISELLDERGLSDGLVHAFKGEQAMGLDTINWLTRSSNASLVGIAGGRSTPERVMITLLRPMFRLSGVRMSQRQSVRVANAGNANLPAMTANLPNVERELLSGTPLRRSTRRLEAILEPTFRRVLITQSNVRAQRRATAIKLALRLYQLDHDGQPPDRLEALVPRYLPAVPPDPFAAEGRPMGYVRSMVVEGVTTPVIYSVGENGADNGASTQPAGSRTSRWASQSLFDNAYDREDLLFPMKRPAPADPPPPEVDESTLPQAEDHQGDPPEPGVQQPDGQQQQQ